jgi:hypothetical protein
VYTTASLWYSLIFKNLCKKSFILSLSSH